jgi:hypothetical protein
MFPGQVAATGRVDRWALQRQILLRVAQVACGMKPLEPARRP